ncbi:hypothetical protein FB45DRAFT_792684 [Roridomyces roridus]|uniref:Uncharacterized protein n=1 Tax=Roridomyces roridus TaxID=1738132 RepID=A0AAD7BTB4_9AGAR|nr:hypothetical protein FB45DRAFT_792684 [Roridomyces roridus]
MQRCLQVPELVNLFCSHLYEAKSPHSRRSPNVGSCAGLGDLAVLAVTAKIFSRHALALMWNSVTFEILLRCLPTDCYESFMMHSVIYSSGHDKEERTSEVIDMIRPLDESDFERIRIYAPFIRNLWCGDEKSKFLPSTLPWFHDNPLPNLRGLYWMHGESDFHHIQFFLSPRITTLHIGHPSLAALTFLLALPRRFPQLAYLALFTELDGVPSLEISAVPTVSACLRGLHAIESLTLATDTLDAPALEHLARLRIPSLRHLDVSGVPADLKPLGGEKAYFASLRALHFTSDIQSACRFLEWCPQKLALAKFSAEISEAATAQEAQHMLSVAVGGIVDSSLRDFSLHNANTTGLDSTVHLISSSSLRTLFAFTNMTSVVIESAFGIDVDDATVTDMARTWPRIERLELRSYRGTPNPRATLQCLEVLAKECPRLTHLGIALDASSVPKLRLGVRGKGSSTSTSTSLRHLDVGDSPISRPTSVAKWMKHVFPRLVGIKTLTDDLELKKGQSEAGEGLVDGTVRYGRHWKKVLSILCESRN